MKNAVITHIAGVANQRKKALVNEYITDFGIVPVLNEELVDDYDLATVLDVITEAGIRYSSRILAKDGEKYLDTFLLHNASVLVDSHHDRFFKDMANVVLSGEAYVPGVADIEEEIGVTAFAFLGMLRTTMGDKLAQ